jgi:hypothetical protein
MRMDDRSLRVLPPILRNKHYDLASAFTPESLLREARRQKDVPNTPVPEICVLDPDGDIVRHLRAAGRSRPVAGWACYHSMMDCFDHGDREYGIVGCAVGASYAVHGGPFQREVNRSAPAPTCRCRGINSIVFKCKQIRAASRPVRKTVPRQFSAHCFRSPSRWPVRQSTADRQRLAARTIRQSDGPRAPGLLPVLLHRRAP